MTKEKGKHVPEKENISYQEKRNIAYLISTLVIFALYGIFVYPKADTSSTNIFRFWGSVILLLVPVQIVLNIIMHVGFSIFHEIPGPSQLLTKLFSRSDQ